MGKCKECRIAYSAVYYQTNKCDFQLTGQLRYQKNKEKQLSQARERRTLRSEDERKDVKAKRRQYYLNNKAASCAYSNQYSKKRCKIDPNFRVRLNLKGRINRALKNGNAKKKFGTVQLIGCSSEELKRHIESQFKPGMTWENYGFYGWHIDHIRPCASFDLADEEQQKACFSYLNLQPLWATENFQKNGKYNPQSNDYVNNISLPLLI